jgi:mono/diheme cytochrome c family protein
MHPITATKIALSSLALTLAPVVAGAAPAAENWESHCATCHGADGKGQTKIGKKLQLKDYTDAKVQAGMKDEEMTRAITDGLKVDGKDRKKGFKDKLTADEIKDLVAYVRKFKT